MGQSGGTPTPSLSSTNPYAARCSWGRGDTADTGCADRWGRHRRAVGSEWRLLATRGRIGATVPAGAAGPSAAVRVPAVSCVRSTGEDSRMAGGALGTEVPRGAEEWRFVARADLWTSDPNGRRNDGFPRSYEGQPGGGPR